VSRLLRVLYRKELRQLLAARSAIVTGALVPTFLLGVIPWMLAFTVSHASSHRTGRPLPEAMRFGFFGEVGSDPRLMPGAMLPVMVAIVGLILPTMMASTLLITERERRTLELLVALPVRLSDVLTAKLLATLTVSSAITVPLLSIAVIGFPLLGVGTVTQVLLLPVLLVAALALSSSTALLMALLSKDFRTANNVAGALLAPTILATMLLGFLLPGGLVRPLCISIAYALGALGTLRYALRASTFEKLLS